MAQVFNDLGTMIKFKHFYEFYNWMERESFFAMIINVLFNLWCGPIVWWEHRYQHDWFQWLRDRLPKYGVVGRVAFRLLDTTNNPSPTFGETIVFFTGIAVYTVIWGIFSPIFVTLAILIAVTETWRDLRND